MKRKFIYALLIFVMAFSSVAFNVSAETEAPSVTPSVAPSDAPSALPSDPSTTPTAPPVDFFTAAPEGSEFVSNAGSVAVDFTINNTTSAPVTLLSLELTAINGQPVNVVTQSWTLAPYPTVPVGDSHVLKCDDGIYTSVNFTSEMLNKPITFTLTYQPEGAPEPLTATADMTMILIAPDIELERAFSNIAPEVGELVTITYTITNPNPVRTSVHLKDPYFIEPEGVTIDVIEPNRSATVERTLVFDGTAESLPEITYVCTYGSESPQSKKTFDKIELSASAPKLSVILTPSNTSVVPGSQIYLNVYVKNTGNIRLETVTISAENFNLNKVLSLEPGEEYKDKIAVTVNQSTTYRLLATGETASGNSASQSASVSVKTSHQSIDVNVDISVSTDTPDLSAESNVIFTIKLKNNDSSTYKNIEIYEDSLGLLTTVSRLTGEQSLTYTIKVTETKTFSFSARIMDVYGELHSKYAEPITVTLNSVVDPSQPPQTAAPSPSSSQSPTQTTIDGPGGNFTNLFDGILTVLIICAILTLLSGLSLICLLIYSSTRKRKQRKANEAMYSEISSSHRRTRRR